MAGWSPEPDDITDQQCEHCGLWFTAQGFHNHQQSCPLEGTDVVFVSPGDSADSVPDTEPVDSLKPDDGESTDTEDSVEGTENSVVATDGGAPGLGLEGPPTPQQAVQDAGEDAEGSGPGHQTDALSCEHCGADAGLSRDELEAGKLYRCTECDGRLRWSP